MLKPAASRVGERRPSATISSGAARRVPSVRVSVTPCGPMSRWVTCAGIISRASGAAASASRSTSRSWRFSTIVPSGGVSGAVSKSSAPPRPCCWGPPSLTLIARIGQPCPVRRSAMPSTSNICQVALAIAEARPSKPGAIVASGSAGSTITLDRPWCASASASVWPTRPPPEMITSLRWMFVMGFCPRPH